MAKGKSKLAGTRAGGAGVNAKASAGGSPTKAQTSAENAIYSKTKVTEIRTELDNAPIGTMVGINYDSGSSVVYTKVGNVMGGAWLETNYENNGMRQGYFNGDSRKLASYLSSAFKSKSVSKGVSEKKRKQVKDMANTSWRVDL